MLEKEQILLIIYFTLIILFFLIFGIVFFIAFQKRKNKLLLEKLQAEKQFEETLQTSKIEIQEQTLRNVSWELHDNIGQLLSTAMLQINMASNNNNQIKEEDLADVKVLLQSSMKEVRSLSHTLNYKVLENIGLDKSVKAELERFERLNFLKTSFTIEGTPFEVNAKDEVIIFRIIQEFFSNTIKYGEANCLDVLFNYYVKGLAITLKDDGIGFDMNHQNKGAGLLNMKGRADLLQATYDLTTQPGKGTSLQLTYPYKIHYS
ncbi:histidine kinase [Aquimarina sp. ERC-38]|uniref:sensor histidine kinase n=1 Tax=Aquimarina sp. ERC-38 TaxID=2949996 RepID=UPI00224757B9|nr:ATP-binding protein [Aquimarina sp. ERC-38]UZO79898.1 histidine kinase [Aquimarina sp. ERC-38]